MRIDAPSITGSFVVNNATLPDISGLATVSGNTFTGNQVINGTIVATGTTLVSGSAQVSYTGITNIPSGIVSGSAQTIANLPSGVVSGSAQTIANLPSGTISGSAQVTTFGFGTTGSNTFQGTQTVNGSLVVTGSLTAQQFIVSSSVTYLTESFASGSHKFGDSSDDNHNFTGSVYVNGTLNVNNGTIFTTASSVSIGSTNPTEKLDVYGSVRFRTALQSDSYYATLAQNAYYTGAWLKYGSGYARTIQLGDGISFKISNAGAGNADDGITFITPLTITDAGKVGVGTTSPSYNLDVSGSIRAFHGTTAGVAEFRAIGSSYGGSYNTSLRSIGGAIGVLQLGNNGDNYIIGGNTAAGGYLVFRVNATTESITSGVEAMRIGSTGNVGINDGAPATKLSINGANYVEMATFACTPAGASAIVSSNNGYAQFSNATARHLSNTNVFTATTDGIQILKAGILFITFSQDIITAGTTGYSNCMIQKNKNNISENLITNTNGQWDGINGCVTIDVAANDVINFYYSGAEITSFDPGTWSMYSFMWSSR
jgi:hypothetical protein